MTSVINHSVRYALHASLVLLLTLAVCQSSVAQIFNGSSGESESKSTVGGTPQMHADAEVKQTAWPSVPLPKISMPKISMPDMSVITGPVKSGYGKVTTGTKKAWEGTKEMFTFGKGNSTSQTSSSSQPKQGFWGRMFSPEPEEPNVPQTVGEWMSQPRLDP